MRLARRFGFVALLCAAFVAACGESPSNTKALEIATLFPTNDVAGMGTAMQQGVDLAVKQHASLGNGYTLAALHADPGADPATLMNSLTSNNQVMGIVGPVDDTVAAALLPLISKDQIVTISPLSALPGLTQSDQASAEGLDFTALHPAGSATAFFRLPQTALKEAQAAANIATTGTSSGGLGAQSVFIVDDGTTSGKALAAAFKTALASRHGTFVGQISQKIGANDNTQTIVSAIVAAYPDLVYYAGNGVGGAELRATLTLSGVPLPMLAGDTVADAPNWGNAVGKPLYGGNIAALAAGPDPTTLTSDAAKQFVADYKSAYGVNPTPQSMLAYDAAMVEISALTTLINQGKAPERGLVLAAIRSGQFTGVSGKIAFDANGDNTQPLGYSLYTCDMKGVWTFAKHLG